MILNVPTAINAALSKSLSNHLPKISTLIQRLSLAALGIFGLVSVGHAREEAQFSQWSVVCEDNGYCVAKTADRATTDSTNPNNLFRIARQSGPISKWEISVQTNLKTPGLLGPAIFRIAGQRPFALAPNSGYTLLDRENEYFFTAASSNQALFRRLIDSRQVFVTLGQRSANEVKASFSLIGLSAALLWIDEKQGRVGSRRTVEAPSSRPKTVAGNDTKAEENVSNARTLAMELHRRRFDEETCDVNPDDPDALQTSTNLLDADNTLVIVPCVTAAYNFSFAIYVVNDTAKAASHQIWGVFSEPNGWFGSDILSNVDFDEDTKELSMVHKGRGIGDCGNAGTWTWTSSQVFKLKEFFSKDECDGKDTDWPQVFP